MSRCRHLRWKTLAMHRDTTALRDDDDEVDPREQDNDLAMSLLRRQVPFSCLRTCQAWGPDDALVSPEDCTPERTCFEAMWTPSRSTR